MLERLYILKGPNVLCVRWKLSTNSNYCVINKFLDMNNIIIENRILQHFVKNFTLNYFYIQIDIVLYLFLR